MSDLFGAESTPAATDGAAPPSAIPAEQQPRQRRTRSDAGKPRGPRKPRVEVPTGGVLYQPEADSCDDEELIARIAADRAELARRLTACDERKAAIARAIGSTS